METWHLFQSPSSLVWDSYSIFHKGLPVAAMTAGSAATVEAIFLCVTVSPSPLLAQRTLSYLISQWQCSPERRNSLPCQPWPLPESHPFFKAHLKTCGPYAHPQSWPGVSVIPLRRVQIQPHSMHFFSGAFAFSSAVFLLQHVLKTLMTPDVVVACFAICAPSDHSLVSSNHVSFRKKKCF